MKNQGYALPAVMNSQALFLTMDQTSRARRNLKQKLLHQEYYVYYCTPLEEGFQHDLVLDVLH